MTYKICPICGKQVSSSNYDRHVKAHSSKPRYEHSIDHTGLNCKYCGKLCKNKNSLAQHEIRCVKNPNKLPMVITTHKHIIAWNKGLTKDSDERVRKNSENSQKALQEKIKSGWKPYFATNEYWTTERKQQRSNDKKEFYAKYPEKHPNRILASNKRMTYPEKIAANWFVKNNIVAINQYETAFESNKRFVDFYIPDFKLYVEIDGEYWHKDESEIDLHKDRFALEIQGIKTLRIKPKLGVEKQLTNYFKDHMPI